MPGKLTVVCTVDAWDGIEHTPQKDQLYTIIDTYISPDGRGYYEFEEFQLEGCKLYWWQNCFHLVWHNVDKELQQLGIKTS